MIAAIAKCEVSLRLLLLWHSWILSCCVATNGVKLVEAVISGDVTTTVELWLYFLIPLWIHIGSSSLSKILRCLNLWCDWLLLWSNTGSSAVPESNLLLVILLRQVCDVLLLHPNWLIVQTLIIFLCVNLNPWIPHRLLCLVLVLQRLMLLLLRDLKFLLLKLSLALLGSQLLFLSCKLISYRLLRINLCFQLINLVCL
jgi:hypothetical protein